MSKDSIDETVAPMVTQEIINELKESNNKMRVMLENIDVNSLKDLSRLRCELLKTIELLPSETHEDRNNRCC